MKFKENFVVRGKIIVSEPIRCYFPDKDNYKHLYKVLREKHLYYKARKGLFNDLIESEINDEHLTVEFPLNYPYTKVVSHIIDSLEEYLSKIMEISNDYRIDTYISVSQNEIDEYLKVHLVLEKCMYYKSYNLWINIPTIDDYYEEFITMLIGGIIRLYKEFVSKLRLRE